MAETKTTNALEDLRAKAVPLLKPYVKRISVFGSFARGDHAAGSDIDLLVELKPSDQRPMMGLKWFRIENELGRVLGKRIDLISEKDLSPHLKPFIEQDRVLLYEENGQNPLKEEYKKGARHGDTNYHRKVS